MSEPDWKPRVAVLGAGAVGSFFGGRLARSGLQVTLIGRPSQVEAVNQHGLEIDGVDSHERIPISATIDPGAAAGAELVLVAVKTLDTVTAATALAPHLGPNAVVLSLQNGVDNVERMRSAISGPIAPAVVYVAAAMTAPGSVKHTGRGDLIIGNLPIRNGGMPVPDAQLGQIAALFASASVPCRVTDNVEADLWTKLIMNCAYNAISAVTGSRYGPISDNPWTREVMRLVVEECVTVARASDVRLPDADLVQGAFALGQAMRAALASTAQDLERGKPTEIDSLNGFVARRAKELGLAVPVNQTLHALVKMAEEVPPRRTA